MGDIEVDAELLITLVANIPVLWDKSLEEYKSRTENTAEWREVFNELDPGFKAMSTEEMNKYGKAVISKWTNIRDRQIKYLKRLSEGKKTGSQAKSIKKYVYSDQLGFLTKKPIARETVSSQDSEEVADEEETGIRENSGNENEGKTFRQPPSPASLRKRKRGQSGITDVEMSILNKLQEPEDRHLSFFKGILPSLQRLNETETIQFQVEVLTIIQKLQQSRAPPMSTSLPCMQPNPSVPIQPTHVSSPVSAGSQNSSPSHQSTDSVGDEVALWDLSRY